MNLLGPEGPKRNSGAKDGSEHNRLLHEERTNLVTQRVCTECHRNFNDTEGRRAKCSSCRTMTATCACGSKMQRASKTCRECRRQDREANNNWRGGKTHHRKGYVMVRFGTTYIFQHIVIMEEYLGRKLLPHENVHHLNGVRDDNRIDNLELWSTHQPSGQRVVDKIRWAKEILALYEGLDIDSTES